MKRRYCRRGHPRAPYILLVIVIAAAGAYAAGRMSRGYVQPAHTSPTAAPESVQTETIVLDAYSFYAIQFGAFDNDADARALTESSIPPTPSAGRTNCRPECSAVWRSWSRKRRFRPARR